MTPTLAKLVTIGDPGQSVFSFAGALEGTLTNVLPGILPDDGLTVTALRTNYRSAVPLVRLGSDLIKQNYADHGGDWRLPYQPAVARPHAPETAKITFWEFPTPAIEAAAVIDAAIQAGFANCAVISRLKAQLGHIEAELISRSLSGQDIPFVNLSGGSFFAQPHISRICNYLALAYDGTNAEAFKDVFNIPSAWWTMPYTSPLGERGHYAPYRGAGKHVDWVLEQCPRGWADIDKIYAHDDGWKLTDAIYDMQSLLQAILLSLTHSVGSAIRTVIKDCLTPYYVGLEGEVPQQVEDDWNVLQDLAAGYGSETGAFLEYVQAALDKAERDKNADRSNALTLTTAHSAMGQEFDTVFVIGVSEGSVSTESDESDDEESNTRPVGIWPHTFAITGTVPDRSATVLPSVGQSANSIAEERCIFYVACTRARSALHISSIAKWRDATLWPSRFIAELDLSD